MEVDLSGKIASIPQTHFPWVRGSTIKPQLENLDLVKGLIPDEGLTVIFGKPGSGKTFTTVDLLAHIVNGWDWMGHKIREPRPVAYVAMEGGSRVDNRIAAWMQHHPDGRLKHFHKLQHQINMLHPDQDLVPLINDLKILKPAVVNLDTLNRAMMGGNENSPEDMGRVVANATRITLETGCGVIFTHHSGKDEAKGSRGHSSLVGAADTIIEVSNHNWSVTKQKDGPEGAKVGFKLVPIELGMDRDGDPVTSCIVEADDVHEADKAERLGKNQKIVRDAIMGLEATEIARPPPVGFGWPSSQDIRVVPIEAVRTEADKLFQASTPEQNRRTQKIREGLDGLITKEAIKTREDKVWRLK